MSQTANQVSQQDPPPAGRHSSYWTTQRLARAAQCLSERSAALRLDIQRELRKYGDEYTDTAANVADSAELSIADLLADVYLAEVDRDVKELLEIEAAQHRVKAGTYGICTDCGEVVDPLRIEFNPQVARCLHCQESHERPHRSKQTKTL